MPKIGAGPDPHLKSPWPKAILIVIIVALLVIFVAPKIIEIYNDNLRSTNSRANKS